MLKSNKKVKLKNGDVGIVRFIGEIKNEAGIFYGIDMSEPNGNNDGSHNGVYYFTTHDNYGLFIKKPEIVKTLQKNDYNLPRVTVGDIVGIKQLNCNAIIRFIGWTLFHPEVIWYGLQLEDYQGDNNGTIDTRVYFTCEENKGLFVMCNEIGPKIKSPPKSPKSPKNNHKHNNRKPKRGKKKGKKRKNGKNDNIYNNKNNNNHKEKEKERFHLKMINPFFTGYSQIFINEYKRNEIIPKNIIELIVKYCSSLNVDKTKENRIDSYCVNIFTDRHCYYQMLYNLSY